MKGTTNIQVNGNVYGGIHIGSNRVDVGVPDDCRALPHHTSSWGPGLAFVLSKLCTGIVYAIGGTFVVAAWVTFGSIALTFWTVCRAFQLLSGALLYAERRFGGSHERLVYVPSVLRRDDDEYDDQPKQLESECVDSSEVSRVLAAAVVPARADVRARRSHGASGR